MAENVQNAETVYGVTISDAAGIAALQEIAAADAATRIDEAPVTIIPPPLSHDTSDAQIDFDLPKEEGAGETEEE